MSALSELSETVERLSHIILYLMIPFSGVFLPLYYVPTIYREPLQLFPLIDAVEYFHHGYYGPLMKTYYHLTYTIVTSTALLVFSLALTRLAIKRVQLN